jgi:hypothetical protein
VPVYDLAIAAGQDRDLKSEFPDATAHAIDGAVILSWVASVENELIDRPNLNAHL